METQNSVMPPPLSPEHANIGSFFKEADAVVIGQMLDDDRMIIEAVSTSDRLPKVMHLYCPHALLQIYRIAAIYGFEIEHIHENRVFFREKNMLLMLKS